MPSGAFAIQPAISRRTATRRTNSWRGRATSPRSTMRSSSAAGHNGLVAACYLAGAGLNVCVLERYHEVGGAAISEETIPGLQALDRLLCALAGPAQDLRRAGRLGGASSCWSAIRASSRRSLTARSLTYWNDHGNAGWRASARSARRMPRPTTSTTTRSKCACSVMDKYILRRPPSWDEVASNFRTPEEQKIFQMFYLGAVADIAEYYFDSDQMQATVSSSGIIGTFRGPRDPGTGYVKLYHSMGMATGHRGRWAYVRGAMGAITQALREGRRTPRRHDPDQRQGRSRSSSGTAAPLASCWTAARRSTSDDRALQCRSQADLSRVWSRSAICRPTTGVRSSSIKIESPVIKINMAVRELPKFLALARRSAAAGQHRRSLHRARASITSSRPTTTRSRASRPSTRS